MAEMRIESISAVTLAVHDMSRSVRFYTALGFSVRYGGERAPFTSLHAGSGYLNLIAQPVDRHWSWWGRVILCPAPLLAGGLERARREKPHVAG
jgi:catechol 2,3-dioxygenase-like lactoylglutathione lyase family enzyme